MKCPLFCGHIRISWKQEKAVWKVICRRQAAVSRYGGQARIVTADVHSKKKRAFARKRMKYPLLPGIPVNCRLNSEEEKAKCRATWGRQAADSQCNCPALKVAADVCSKEKGDFCRRTWEMPKLSRKWTKEEKEVLWKAIAQAAGRRELLQSSGKKVDCRHVQQGK